MTSTPLPAARASSLTTYGGPNAASAWSAWPGVPQVNEAAVGMPASAITCLAKDFEPSILAAAASGPKHGMRASRRASAAPATSGASGPTTTRSGPSLRASARMPSGVGGVSGWVCARASMPGLPGAAWNVVAARIEGADQGVLAPARPDDEDAHARSLPASYRSRSLICRVWSRRGPTPTAQTGAPIISSTALM